MRPATLAAVARLTLSGDSFDRALAGFLDEFYARPTAEALSETPPSLAFLDNDHGHVRDAYLAATAEELANAYLFPVPRWADGEDRKLHRPWFASSLAAVRAVLILESPPAFRSRNLSISENALTRA